MRLFALGLLLAALLLSGCLQRPYLDRSKSPTGTSPAENVEVADVPVQGFVARVSFVSFEGKGSFVDLDGELLAVDRRMIWLRVHDYDDCLLALDLSQVASVEVFNVYDASPGGVAAWSGLGLLSTISHGFVLVASSWMWIVPGVAMVGRAVVINDIEVDDSRTLPQLYQYARFPQGIPDAWRMRPQCQLEAR